MNQDTVSAEQRHTLGGRIYVAVDFDSRTVAMDHYLHKIIRASGIDKVMPMGEEDNAVYLVRMQAALIDSGKLSDLLGGYLLPEGVAEVDWTPALARETASLIKRCNTREDRDAVIQLGMDLTFKFFKQGLEYLKRSLRSSASAATRASPTKSLAH